jgi:hypothetical protein
MSVLVRYGLWRLGLAEPEAQTTDTERACLVRHATGKRRLAEIGVWQGRTTRDLRRVMAPDGMLFGVDPYPPGRLGFSAPQRIAMGEVAKVRNGGVIWMLKRGEEAAADPEVVAASPFDFVFIDGEHTWDGLAGDWRGWRPRVGLGGVVALHDSRSCDARVIEDAGSVRFTREVIMKDPGFEIFETADSLTVLRRCR